MASFVFGLNPTTVCAKASRFWCGNINCSAPHRFDTCHNFQNTGRCRNPSCVYLHVSMADEQRHREYGVMTPVLINECIRTKQIVGICRIRNCDADRNKCPYKHVIDFEPISPLSCPVCVDELYRNHPEKSDDHKKCKCLVVLENCNHILCCQCRNYMLAEEKIPGGLVRCPICRTESIGKVIS